MTFLGPALLRLRSLLPAASSPVADLGSFDARSFIIGTAGLSSRDFMAKLASLVPRPRTNRTGPPLCPWVQVRFHGVLARGGLPSNSRYSHNSFCIGLKTILTTSLERESANRNPFVFEQTYDLTFIANTADVDFLLVLDLQRMQTSSLS